MSRLRFSTFTSARLIPSLIFITHSEGYISKYIYTIVFRLLMDDRSSEAPLIRNGDVGRTTAKVTFGGYDLEAMLRAQLQSIFLPSVKVACRADDAVYVGSAPRGSTDTPECFECLGAVDRRLVDTGKSDDIVLAAVADDGTFLHPSRAGVVSTEGIHDIVLDKGVTSPTIDGEGAVSVWQETSRIADITGIQASDSGIYPALALHTGRRRQGSTPFHRNGSPVTPTTGRCTDRQEGWCSWRSLGHLSTTGSRSRHAHQWRWVC